MASTRTMITSYLVFMCPECARERNDLFAFAPVEGTTTVLWWHLSASDIEHLLYTHPCVCGEYDVKVLFHSLTLDPPPKRRRFLNWRHWLKG